MWKDVTYCGLSVTHLCVNVSPQHDFEHAPCHPVTPSDLESHSDLHTFQSPCSVRTARGVCELLTDGKAELEHGPLQPEL